MNNIEKLISKIAGKEIYTQNEHLDEWYSWYQGKSKTFHFYKLYNGEKDVNCEKATLGMAKKGCEDWADLLLNEKCDIIIEEKDKLDIILDDNNFWVKGNQGVDKTFGLGSGGFVVSVKDITVNDDGTLAEELTGRVCIDFINALKIYPITIVNGECIECAFVSTHSEGININIHLLRDGVYKIYSIIGKGKNDNYAFSEPVEFNTMSDIPWFQIYRPNKVNNQDINNDGGISIFANEIDCLKNIDNAFDAFNQEFIQGKKRTYVSSKATRVSKINGEVKRVFDPNDAYFYLLPEDENSEKPYVQVESPDIRSEQLIKGIQQALDLYSFKIGLGTGYYKFDSKGVKTATEVISENSDTFRTLKKHEIILESVLRNLTKAIMYASTTFTPVKFKLDQEITIQFDDSIIEDKDAERKRDMIDVNAGIMSKVEYRMKWYAEDEKTARKQLELVKQEMPDIIE